MGIPSLIPHPTLVLNKSNKIRRSEVETKLPNLKSSSGITKREKLRMVFVG
jgi:hypothetical protein